jgi:hypothetical protein
MMFLNNLLYPIQIIFGVEHEHVRHRFPHAWRENQ